VTATITIDELVLENQPGQFGLLARASSIFMRSAAVTHLLVRGSLANGTADRMSDVDFIVGVRDGDFSSFVRTLDALMATELGALFPGWRDTIVSNMGGLGYVYLVTSESDLYQIDLYVVPAAQVEAVRERTHAQILCARGNEQSASNADLALSSLISSELARPRTCSEMLVEILVLTYMIAKRIKRGQHFISYAQTNLLLNAVKDLIKTALAPTSAYWGWYHLEEDIGVTPLGRMCLDDLAVLISNPQIRTAEALSQTLEQVLAIVHRAAPHSLDEHGPALDSYRHYLEIA
jgi:hypothetical protein